MFFPVNGDPYYSSVSLLLPMTGTNDSTIFTDYSPTPKTITRYGDTKISTAQSKWGQGSGYFDGSGDYLTVAASNVLTGTEDFTFEVWARPHSTPVTDIEMIVSAYNSSGFNIEWNTENKIGLYLHNTPTSYDQSTVVLTPGNFYHIAISRKNDVFYGFVEGQQFFTRSVSKNFDFSTIYIGRDPSSALRDFGIGYLQDLRITKGIARYTADFIPPSGPLPTRLPELLAQRIGQPSFNQIARLGL